VNVEPYLPAVTALLTLLNTCLVFWNGRRMHQMHRRVNGMYLQTLADAEARGREQALTGGVVAMSVPRGSAPQGESPGPGRLTDR
jgi:hypothetical protein